MQKPCAFCERKMIEERIITEDASFIIIASLGQITDGGYALIVPREHGTCIGEMTTGGAAKLFEIAKFTANAIEKVWGVKPVMFEHGGVGQTIQHAHLHLVPAEANLEKQVRRDFPAETDALVSLRDLPRLYQELSEPYLFWQEPDGAPMVCWNPKAPSYYFRRVVAEQLGRTERADWRKMDPDLDRRLWTETRDKLKPFFDKSGEKKKSRG